MAAPNNEGRGGALGDEECGREKILGGIENRSVSLIVLLVYWNYSITKILVSSSRDQRSPSRASPPTSSRSAPSLQLRESEAVSNCSAMTQQLKGGITPLPPHMRTYKDQPPMPPAYSIATNSSLTTNVPLSALPGKAPTSPSTITSENGDQHRFYWQSNANNRSPKSSPVKTQAQSSPVNTQPSEPVFCIEKCFAVDFNISIEVALQVSVYMTLLCFLFHTMHPYYEESFGDEYESVGRRLAEVLNSTGCLAAMSSSKLDSIDSDISILAQKEREEREDDNGEIYTTVSAVIVAFSATCGLLIFMYYAWSKPLQSVLFDKGEIMPRGPGDLSPALTRISVTMLTMIATVVIIFITAVVNFEYGRTDEVVKQLLHGMFPDDVSSHRFGSVNYTGIEIILLILSAVLLALEITYVVIASRHAFKTHRNRHGRQKAFEQKVQAREDFDAELEDKKTQRLIAKMKAQLQAAAIMEQQFKAAKMQRQALERNLHEVHLALADQKKESDKKDAALRQYEETRRVEVGKDAKVLELAKQAKEGGKHSDAAHALTAALETGYTDIEQVLNGTGVYAPKSPKSDTGSRRSASTRQSSNLGSPGAADAEINLDSPAVTGAAGGVPSENGSAAGSSAAGSRRSKGSRKSGSSSSSSSSSHPEEASPPSGPPSPPAVAAPTEEHQDHLTGVEF